MCKSLRHNRNTQYRPRIYQEDDEPHFSSYDTVSGSRRDGDHEIEQDELFGGRFRSRRDYCRKRAGAMKFQRNFKMIGSAYCDKRQIRQPLCFNCLTVVVWIAAHTHLCNFNKIDTRESSEEIITEPFRGVDNSPPLAHPTHNYSKQLFEEESFFGPNPNRTNIDSTDLPPGPLNSTGDDGAHQDNRLF